MQTRACRRTIKKSLNDATWDDGGQTEQNESLSLLRHSVLHNGAETSFTVAWTLGRVDTAFFELGTAQKRNGNACR